MQESMWLSETEIESIRNSVKKIEETYKILNSTLKPEIFFQRLGFLFDTLLSLQKYEDFGIFTENTPSKRLREIQEGLENRVSNFIVRYMRNAWEVSSTIKSEDDKEEKYADFVNKLISALDCAGTFWGGAKGHPHYTGPLFTEANYQHVQAIWDECCDKSFENMILYF